MLLSRKTALITGNIHKFRTDIDFFLQEQLGELNDLAHGPVVLAALGLENAVAAPPPGRRKTLIAAAADAHEVFADAKRFWR